jgi:hypothetical protein
MRYLAVKAYVGADGGTRFYQFHPGLLDYGDDGVWRRIVEVLSTWANVALAEFGRFTTEAGARII